jgi:hypothetical protein
LSTSIVGTPSALEPCHRATTGTEQTRLVLDVAEQDDGVAMPRLEDGRQGERLVRAAVRVAKHHVVATRHRLDRQRLDRASEEGVGDVPHDGAEEHRRRPAQPAGQRVGPVPQAAGSERDALARFGRDRDPRRRVVEHPRHCALRDARLAGDVAHRRQPRAAAVIGFRFCGIRAPGHARSVA